MQISKLYIDRDVVDFPQVHTIQSRLKVPFEIIDGEHDLFDIVNSAEDPVQKAKQGLFLTHNKGAFIKQCPGTSVYTCCGYKILHIGTFCSMDCTYCILQSYYHPPLLRFYVNHGDMQVEIEKLIAEKGISRIGTGEFTDSLIWEKWTDLSEWLVDMFSQQSHAVLELKTKTTAIEKLKNLPHNRKTIAAWSLNTDTVIQDEERFTSSLSARLRAAATCESWGYPIAFHFDPMIIYDGCEADYKRVVKQIFSHVTPENITWISLGTFRFMPSLKTMIQKRYPKSKIIYGEFITGLDGKMRYFKPLRIRLYRKMIQWIRETAPEVPVYLCMEDDEVWEKSLGFVPSARGGLTRMLDESTAIHCGLDDNI